ncbi:Uncharacterised protein [Mycobacterium tuberculosis]|nr:Uncharacterised protein [Mycobacterium tuberculosis]
MLFQTCSKLRTFCVFHTDKVLNTHRVHDLTAKALCHNTGTDTFASCVDRGTGTSWAAADNKHIEWLFIGKCGCIWSITHFGENFFERHTTAAEVFTIQEHRRYGHDVFAFHFFLVCCTVNHGVCDARIEDTHQVQCLYNIGTIVAAQADVSLEVIFAFNAFHLIDYALINLWSSSAYLQQGEHQ